MSEPDSLGDVVSAMGRVARCVEAFKLERLEMKETPMADRCVLLCLIHSTCG